MYYPSSENKGADQLRGYPEADLRLCFRIGNNPVFSRCGSNSTIVTPESATPLSGEGVRGMETTSKARKNVKNFVKIESNNVDFFLILTQCKINKMFCVSLVLFSLKSPVNKVILKRTE